MKLGLPRKRAILAFHRWLGVLSALFLLVLALTGLALNHTERLGLNNVTISNGLILERYGMVGASDIQSFGIGDTATISHLDGQLFYNGDYLTDAGEPVGYFKAEGFSVIACPARLVFLTDQGEFIEQLNVSRLPFDEVTFLAVGDGKSPVIVAGDGQWQPDVDWLEFSPHVGAFSVNPLPVVEAGTEVRESILSLYQGKGITLYRFLLDLHSGRLLGWGGRTVMDLTAVAIILLVSSGLVGWLRKSAWGRR